MATLVLTAAGSLLGPVGGAVGALFGQAIDNRILQPKRRSGPRLQDLRVQTSSYGTSVPKLFGSMRVAGTVIWSTDLIEHRSRNGGSKGRPSANTYSYSASFAVALSSRPIIRVGRIWADGNLLRGEAGDWKHETGFRLHTGHEDQAPDPFIVSAEGSKNTPAYRGLAYGVFENMALEPFGNRIPSLTFEVEADADAVPVGTILSELTRGGIAGGGGASLQGFAASGDDLSQLVSVLAPAIPVVLRERPQDLLLVEDAEPAMLIGREEVPEDSRSRSLAREPASSSITIRHYDPSRDYQVGVQSVGAGSGKAEHIELPAVLSAQEALSLAHQTMDRRRRERTRLSVRCGWKRLDIFPGSTVAFAGETYPWRVLRRSIDRDGVQLDLQSCRPVSRPLLAVDHGRSVKAVDRYHGVTRLALLDLPSMTDVPDSSPAVQIAAWGDSPGWRRSNLFVSQDDGSSWEHIGRTAAPAIGGVVESVLASGPAAVFDNVNSFVVQLAHSDMQLEDADDRRLLGGANLAAVGHELVQFGRVEPLGERRWRLSRLLRGRHGTDWAVAGHSSEETFVLIEPGTLAVHTLPLSSLGASVRVTASGLGDPLPVERTITVRGENVRPLSPVHLVARPTPANAFHVSWVRRSRSGFAWSTVESPLGEQDEIYSVTIRRVNGDQRSFETAERQFIYGPDAMATDRAVGDHVDILVAQIGSMSVSRPATLRISI